MHEVCCTLVCMERQARLLLSGPSIKQVLKPPGYKKPPLPKPKPKPTEVRIQWCRRLSACCHSCCSSACYRCCCWPCLRFAFAGAQVISPPCARALLVRWNLQTFTSPVRTAEWRRCACGQEEAFKHWARRLHGKREGQATHFLALCMLHLVACVGSAHSSSLCPCACRAVGAVLLLGASSASMHSLLSSPSIRACNPP